MSCFTDEKATLGMVRVETDKVIFACNKMLKSISAYRSNARRKFCREWLASATKNWQRLWRWFGFRKPSRRDALNDFYHGSHFPPSFSVTIVYSSQEEKCKDLLRAAKATNGVSMWISTEGARVCRL